jgi:hypothetical protein
MPTSLALVRNRSSKVRLPSSKIRRVGKLLSRVSPGFRHDVSNHILCYDQILSRANLTSQFVSTSDFPTL